MLQAAILELGSPHFRLLRAHVALDGSLSIDQDRHEYVHISDLDRLKPDEWQHALEALERLSREARNAGPVTLSAIVTGRMSTARNGDEFVAKASELCGMKVLRFTREDEAALVLNAVRRQLSLWNARLLVVKVDCDTVDFTVGVDSYVELRLSLPIGPQSLREASTSTLGPTRISDGQLRYVLGRALATRLGAVREFQPSHVVFVGPEARAHRKRSSSALVLGALAHALGLDRILISDMDAAHAALERSGRLLASSAVPHAPGAATTRHLGVVASR